MAELIKWRDCPCDGCKVNPCGHPARCVTFALWLNKTVDAVEVVHGRWDYPTKIKGSTWDVPHCSLCNKASLFRTNYCSNCGAKMDGDGNG